MVCSRCRPRGSETVFMTGGRDARRVEHRITHRSTNSLYSRSMVHSNHIRNKRSGEELNFTRRITTAELPEPPGARTGCPEQQGPVSISARTLRVRRAEGMC